MDLKLEVGWSYCGVYSFVINGINADEDDFGTSYDANPEDAPEYGCGNRVFEGKLPTNEILKKYNITKDEYFVIVEKLTEKLSFGQCGLCA